MSTPVKPVEHKPAEHAKPAEHKPADAKTDPKSIKPPTAEEVAKAEAKAKADAAAKAELEFISGGAFMLTPELASPTTPVRARNEKQQAMDRKVKEMHGTWVKGGKPTSWDAMVKAGTVATYFTEPEKSADLHKLITRAVALHGVRSKFGTPFKVTEAHVARYGLPQHYLGREAISFAIMDKRPRATSDGKSASEIIKK